MALLLGVLLVVGSLSSGISAAPVPSVTCSMDGIVVSLDASEMTSQGYQGFSLQNSLDSQCIGSAAGRVSLSSAALLRGACGLHFSSANGIVTMNGTVHLLATSPNPNVDIPISCTFALNTLSVVESVGTTPRAEMTVFVDSNYTIPESGALPLGKKVYVKVQLVSPNEEGIVLLLENCYATATASADDANRVSLLQSGTSVPGPFSAKVVQNGDSDQGKFTFKMFKFRQQPSDLYLHCGVHVCVQSSGACHQERRRRRSADGNIRQSSMIVSQGPFSYYEE
ncbi:uromodulin-like [Lissotriton helveticus]